MALAFTVQSQRDSRTREHSGDAGGAFIFILHVPCNSERRNLSLQGCQASVTRGVEDFPLAIQVVGPRVSVDAAEGFRLHKYVRLSGYAVLFAVLWAILPT